LPKGDTDLIGASLLLAEPRIRERLRTRIGSSRATQQSEQKLFGPEWQRYEAPPATSWSSRASRFRSVSRLRWSLSVEPLFVFGAVIFFIALSS
jgi:hypothetical protein